MQIKNIIFDYGGVILNIDPSLTFKALKEAGTEDIEGLHLHLTTQEFYNKLETGQITPEEFRKSIKEYTKTNMTNQQIDDAWNALILDMPAHRIKLLEEIRSKYRIFMLSNTNKIHYDKYRADLERDFGYPDFSHLFEKAHFSHEIGYRKPDARIFQYVLDVHGLKPEETLFIDDSLINVEAADCLGMTGLLLENGVEINDLFEDGFFKFA